MKKDFLFLIPARGGSKGIRGKNVKPLNGVPLIHYSIDLARQFAADNRICLSTDNPGIANLAEEHGLPVWFKRPRKFSGDKAGTYEVILHAIEYCFRNNFRPDAVVLLQPTSPLRLKKHLADAMRLYTDAVDMVVSVKAMKKNPYATIYKAEGSSGLSRLFPAHANGGRRQDVGKLFELNGAVYVMNVKSLLRTHIRDFSKIRRLEMPEYNSVDLDDLSDWQYCEFLLKSGVVKLDYKVKNR